MHRVDPEGVPEGPGRGGDAGDRGAGAVRLPRLAAAPARPSPRCRWSRSAKMATGPRWRCSRTVSCSPVRWSTWCPGRLTTTFQSCHSCNERARLRVSMVREEPQQIRSGRRGRRTRPERVRQRVRRRRRARPRPHAPHRRWPTVTQSTPVGAGLPLDGHPDRRFRRLRRPGADRHRRRRHGELARQGDDPLQAGPEPAGDHHHGRSAGRLGKPRSSPSRPSGTPTT